MRPRTGVGKGLPLRIRHEILVAPVGQLRAGHRRLTIQVLRRRLPYGGLDPVGQERIDQDVDAAEEEAGHRGDRVDGLSFGGPPLQRPHVCPGYLFVCLYREEQGDVDVDALVEQLFDRRYPSRSSRDLDHQVGAIHGSPQVPRLRQ